MKLWLIFYRDRWGRVHRMIINSEGRKKIALKLIEDSNPRLELLQVTEVDVPE